MPKVDNPETTALPLAARCPAKFTKASAPRNESTLSRTKDERELQCAVVIVREKPVELIGEDGRLYEPHSSTIRH